MLKYAGIGSRQTPDDILNIMTSIGEQLAPKWIVRSGFADGADKAFCLGAENANGAMENYLPWKGFNGAPHDDPRFIWDHDQAIIQAAHLIAKRFHPAWDRCSNGAKSMHTRNVFQVLGKDLYTPSDMVICWTPNASGSGGTGQAIRIAKWAGIPVFDLADAKSHVDLCVFVGLTEGQS